MKTALIFGSSGLIGNQLLSKIIESNNYNKIKLFVRSVPEINDPKIEIIKTNFNDLKNHKKDIKGDDCFFCIGTTKKNTPDKEEYRRIEYNIPVEMHKLPNQTQLILSSMFHLDLPILKILVLI